ncbi:MAG: cytochrome c maturation protein CcmE [Myxococcota bacterium]|nr:cytochrome c maturation protein CcmE [Myxococcota bacterium]
MADRPLVEERAELAPSTKRFAIGAIGVVFVAVAALAFGGLGDNLVYYWDASQLRENQATAVGATIRLGGQVKPGTIDLDEDATILRFEVTDGKATVPVQAKGLPPAMFRESIGVIVEGTLQENGIFVSDRLLVSHDNEYRAPKEGDDTSVEDLAKTARGAAEP